MMNTHVHGITSVMSRHPAIPIVLACALLYAPFSAKPFFMDSPITVYMARQIIASPVDPPAGGYGTLLAPWNHTDLPQSSAYHATPHPPLVPLYLAPFVAAFGTNEAVLNWAMFPFFALAALFFFGLASLLATAYKSWATALFTLSPVVFVNAQDVMLDVPLAAFSMGALYYMLRSRRKSDALVSGLFASLACLTKFTGGTVVLSGIALYALSKKWKECGLFVLPCAVLYGGWIAHNLLVWHNIQLLANGHMHYTASDVRYRFERMMSCFGGAIILPAFPLALAFSVKSMRRPAALASAAAAAWSLLLWNRLHYSAWSAALFALCASSGVVLLYAAGKVITSRAAPQATALAVHVAGQIGGGLFLTLYASRYLLPFVFAGVIGFLSMVEEIKGRATRRIVLSAALSCGATLAVLLSISGFQWAKADKNAARDVATLAAGHDVYFSGRLGYLYYFDKAGAKSLLFRGNRPGPRDLLVQNANNKDDAEFFSDTSGLELVKQLDYPVFPVRGIGGRAGFYGDDRLPYAWVTDPAGRIFRIFRRK